MTNSSKYQAVVIGASAGGTTALQKILPFLPEDFPLPVVIAQHLHPLQDGAAIIHYSGGSALTVKDADEKDLIRAGFVYFAPPNYHLLIEDDHTFSLSVDAKVHFTRPSVDVLFESAADAYGAGLIGIILSGANQDGAAGLLRIKQRGGLTIVQDPQDADMSYMPKAAIASAHPDHILAADKICKILIELTTSRA
jgi:two-component system, chemotaxis family, protein-glutamate methylesterase/glutaminase